MNLAKAAKVSTGTVVRLDRGEVLRERTVEAIQGALEKSGVEFIAENGEFRLKILYPAKLIVGWNDVAGVTLVDRTEGRLA